VSEGYIGMNINRALLAVGVLAGAIGVVYALYMFVMNQKRYRHVRQELFSPNLDDEAAVAELNWVACDTQVLGYSSNSDATKKPGHAGNAHSGVLMALPIIYDDTISWPPLDKKLQVSNARYFFRSINGLKVAYNEESPDAESAWGSGDSNTDAVKPIGKQGPTEADHF